MPDEKNRNVLLANIRISDHVLVAYAFGRIRLLRIVQNYISDKLWLYIDAPMGLIDREDADMELEFDENVVVPSNN